MPRFEECVRNCDELSSDCCDDDFVWLARVTQTICENLEMRIVMTRDESSLEHDVSYLSPSATNGALAAHRAAVVRNGGQASEGSSLFSRELAQFWHFRDQHSAGNGADPRDRTQDTSGLCKALICARSLLRVSTSCARFDAKALRRRNFHVAVRALRLVEMP